MNMGVTYPQAREGRITAAITTAGTADTKAAIMAAAMTRDPAAAVKTREIADMKAAETITAAMTKDPAEVVKTIGTAGTMTAVTAAMAAVMASDPDRAVKTIGTAGTMTAVTAAIMAAAMTRDPGYGGYNDGYDERPGQGRGDERNRGYNDGGYSGGYDERPGRGYDDYGYDNRRDAAYGQPGAVNGAYGTERDEWGMRNPAEPVNNREQPADHERPGEAARRFLELLDQKDIHYSFRKLQDSFDQIQAVFTGNDIPEVILNFVFDDEDGAVTIQVGDIVPQLYDGQRSRALDVVNALNCQYTFGTFTINDDNDIKFRIDALITPENAASTCYALMVKALKICDESYMRFLHM